jgi:hypothetical protein
LAKDILNGENSLDATFTCPEGHTFNVATVINLENKRKSKGGKVDLKVTLPEQKPYAVKYEGRIADLDMHEHTFTVISDLKVDFKGEEDVHVRAQVGSALPGNYRSYSGKVFQPTVILPSYTK